MIVAQAHLDSVRTLWGEAARLVEFRLLGPIEAVDKERPIALGGPRQRVVLAALALQPGQVVSVGQLVDALWGEDPPATAQQQVFTCISTLRRALDGLIATRPSGYALCVEPDQVDVNVFDTHVAAARRAVAEGQLETAAGRLQAAYGLWRGPALGGAPGLAAQAARLEEQRLAVIEERVELELALGRHSDLVPDLSALVATHPLRERLVRQLMVALYRCGRRADALEAYRLAEKRLASELGLDPGDELRRLELAILRADPALDGPQPTLASVVPAPAQLLPDIAGFTGRGGDLSALTSLLDQNGDAVPVVIAAIVGSAGVGKTTLATHWAHQIAHRFPDGQLFVDLRGHSPGPRMRPVDALAQFLRALGVSAERVPVDMAEAAAMYRSLLAGRRALVLLDNAANVDQVRPLLPGSAGCLVLVTSREKLGGLVASHGAHRLTLDVLTPSESVELLACTASARRVATEPAAAAELARLCGGLPLALRIAAANLSDHPHRTIADYVVELAGGNRLAALQIDGDEQTAVRTAFDLSYAGLGAEARDLFRLLGLVPGPDFTDEAAAVLADIAPADARRLLSRLVAAHLIIPCAPNRFMFHDLLRLYAVERAATGDETLRQGAWERLCRWYLYSADAAARLSYPGRLRLPVPPAEAGQPRAGLDNNPTAAMAWLDTERPNLLAVVDRAATTGPYATAWLIADTFRGYFVLRRHAVDWLSMAEAGRAAARAAGDEKAEAAMLLSLGDASWKAARHSEAERHYRRAAELSRRAGCLDLEAAATGNLGVVYREIGRPVDTIDACSRAAAINHQLGLPQGEATQLMNLGLTCDELGRTAEALDHLRRALALSRQHALRDIECIALCNLALVERGAGLFQVARERLARAIPLSRELGARIGEAYCLIMLARLDRDQGRWMEGVDHAQAALALAREFGGPVEEAEALNTLGELRQLQAHHRDAIEHHERALHLAHESKLALNEADALVGLAHACRELTEYHQARDYAERALAIAARSQLRVLSGQAFGALAEVCHAEGRLDDAAAHAQEALEILRGTGQRLELGRILLLLGRIASRSGAADTAESRWREALAIFTDLEVPEAERARALLGGYASGKASQ